MDFAAPCRDGSRGAFSTCGPRVHLKILQGTRDLLPLAAAQPQRYPCLLESAAQGPGARFDLLFAQCGEWLELREEGRVRDECGADRGGDFLASLDALWRASAPAAAPPHGLPFSGGWLLFLAYEMAAQIEPTLHLPAAADNCMPRALAVRCPAAVIVDRWQRRTTLVAEPGYAQWLEILLRDLDAAPALAPAPASRAQLDEDPAQQFTAGVARIQQHLRAGDVFQANLSREWRARFDHAPRAADLYARLRSANPAPHAGLLQWQDWAIASSSPERLLQVRGGVAQTRPIAGTRPRVAGDDDVSRVRELLAHAKERAEHVMLVDLERNDLGRVCAPGSIVVDPLMAVESFAHVHHIVSEVRGTLRAGITPGAAIAAVFPGGTITGCPKLRCMQVIAGLEGVGRGAYTGALGYLDRSGELDLNILIRSISLCGNALRFRAGAGIVADSDAALELAETRAKARGMLRALGADA